MPHPFRIETSVEIEATPEEVWEAITTGPGVDSWLMGRTEVDSANKTATFEMFGDCVAMHAELGCYLPQRRALLITLDRAFNLI